MSSVVHLSEEGPSARWLRLAALSWDRVCPVFWGSHDLEFIATKVGTSANTLDFVDGVDMFDTLKDESLWETYRQWLDTNVPPPSQFFSRLGWPITTGQTTADLLPANWLTERLFLELGRRGYLRHRAYYMGRDEGGWFFDEVKPDWIEHQYRLGWPDQRRPFEERLKVVVSSHLVSHLLWLAASQLAPNRAADLYVSADPQFFLDHSAVAKPDPLQASTKISVVALALPTDIETLPFARIIELRERLVEARRKYAREVNRVISECQAASDEHTLNRVIQQDVLGLARDKFYDAMRSYKLARLETIVRSIAIATGPPSILATLNSMLHVSVFEPAGMVAGLSLGAAGLLIGREKAKLEQRRNPWAYLASLGASTKHQGLSQAPMLFEDEPFRRVISIDEYNRYY